MPIKKHSLKPKEKNVHQQVCDFLKLQYPSVIFTSDASGMRCSMGLRMELKRKRCANYLIPDLLILEPRNGRCGLLIEIKRDKSEMYNKDGSYKFNPRIEEQRKSLIRLHELGYKTGFAFGFDHCVSVIKEYLK